MKKHPDTAAVLARGRRISGELFQAAVSGMRRIGEAIGEDPEPAIWTITTRYRALLAAAEEAAWLELTPAGSEELPKSVSFLI